MVQNVTTNFSPFNSFLQNVRSCGWRHLSSTDALTCSPSSDQSRLQRVFATTHNPPATYDLSLALACSAVLLVVSWSWPQVYHSLASVPARKVGHNFRSHYSGVEARCWNVGRYGESLHLLRDIHQRRAGRMWEQVRKKLTPQLTCSSLISWPQFRPGPYADSWHYTIWTVCQRW